MPTIARSYAFCADYSDISACLFAIQTLEKRGALDAEASRLLSLFENNELRKLYLRTLRILGVIDDVEEVPKIYIGGDYHVMDFSGNDFNIGYLVVDPDKTDGNGGYLLGDFETEDFSALDFFTGYKDATNEGYSSTFQTILNIFKVFCSRSNEISEEGKAAIDAALIPVLDAIEEIQEYLNSKGLNPCTATEEKYSNNSPGVYLQVAGSDGTDGIAEGLHLRWSLSGELGSNHIPKGNYNNTTNSDTGFNKPDDYVRISRTPYVDPVLAIVDFEHDKPIINFNKKMWTYVISQTVNDKKITNRVRLTFTSSLYNKLATTLRPDVSAFEFLNHYTGVIKIEVLDKTAFRVSADFQKTSAPGDVTLKMEALCQSQNRMEASEPVNIRKTHVLKQESTNTVELSGENIRSVKLKKSASGKLKKFSFETYHDFLSTRRAADWTVIGNEFGLSLDDQVVFNRLENSSYQIDNKWPHYNNGTYVRVSNYKDKWSSVRLDEPGIKEAVAKYLHLSETDPHATDILKSENEGLENPGLEMSYLNILNLQGMDYHMARMLGLGHIDVPVNTSVNDQFIYQLNYTNRKELNSNEIITYTYTGLPISKLDQLLPEKPEMRALSYGLPVADSEVNTIFDEHGYTHLDQIRAINIGRKPHRDEIPDHDFFADLSAIENDNVFENSRPVLYGVEYRPDYETEYIKPEITHEKSMGKPYYAYDDSNPSAGVLETVPVLDDATSLYIHFERQTGIHHYAIYAINWFSRASAVSDEVATDETIFPVRNPLLPPTDVTVQYIQKEEPLLFTTGLEQSWLAGRAQAFPNKDINFSRVTFNWLDITDVSHLAVASPVELKKIIRPDKVNAHFKSGLLLEVTGKIKNVVPVAGSDTQLRLYTGGYKLIDGTTVTPAIASEDLFRFTDSLLTTTAGQFHVIGITNANQGPVITVEKAYNVELVDDDEQPGNFASQKNYIAPELNSRFSMVENIGNQANWVPVEEAVSLFSFADADDPHIESVVDTEGNVTKQWIGGLNANAVVSPLFSDTGGADDLPGYYKISFTEALPVHPQVNLPYDASDPEKNNPAALRKAHVEWYKGHIRIPKLTSATDKKMLEVATIAQNNPLILYAYDPTYQEGPILSSVSDQDKVSVNFHPGYKAYIFPETGPSHTFNGEHLLPEEGANDRKSLFGLQTADTLSGNDFVSKISVPAVLLSRRIETPVQLEPPMAPGLKVRPDATGKAAFTFDTKIAATLGGAKRSPFGFMFYRTSLEEVMHAFYAPETIVQILEDLAGLTEDPAHDLRAYELVNLIFSNVQALQFRTFDAQPQPYGFPVPDKQGLLAQHDSQVVKLDKLRTAIEQGLLPLTEQPPIFSFIKTGYQTENTLPAIRDIDGNLLNASDPKFNPFPMVRKYTKGEEPNVTYVRFTDYILNGASRNLYFYAGAEVTSQLIPGALSMFTGPVSVLNVNASAAPLINKFSLGASVDSAAVVTFQLAAISPEDRISKIRVYRTLEQAKANTFGTMDSYFDVEIEEGLLTGYEITDRFSELSSIPLGKTVYYRFAGIRMIINEKNIAEEVISKGSDVISVKLIDTSNPEAPELIYVAAANKLTWLPTTTSGTYYLFKQNKRGNWERIYTVENASGTLEYALPSPLVLQDEDGNRIFHRFKVQVQNVSGLFNLADNELTV